jgi:hypothetical protein
VNVISMPELQPESHIHSHDEWNNDTRPHSLSSEEWRELMGVPEVRESWGLTHETTEEFAKIAYAAKFHFISGSPGYVGDLYILQGDTLTGDHPFVLKRDEDGHLLLT